MELAAGPGAVLLCGRYESVDERLIRRAVDEEISIGDYVLSGGELAAMVLMDAVVRQLPGVLGDEDSAAQDSFVGGLLDCPHYTRPEEYAGERVPPVLLSGNHAEIRTLAPEAGAGQDLAETAGFAGKARVERDRERKLLEEFKREQGNHAQLKGSMNNEHLIRQAGTRRNHPPGQDRPCVRRPATP